MHLVSPKLPTVLHHQTAVDLAYDLWFYDANGVYVLPGTIDVEKFKNALSNTLQLYPHAAGQLRCQDGRWFIELTNTPVPLSVSHVEKKSSSSFLQEDWVWQTNLTPLTFPQRTHTSLVNGTEPLLRCQLTFFLEETCIGISWHHILGDATARFRFIHTLSQFYQNKVPEFPTPTFRKHVLPPPSEAIATEYYPKMPLLHHAYPFAEIGAKFAEAKKGVEILNWRFTGEELRRLHASVSSSGQQALTIQDCLTAYIVTVLNRCQENPIRIVTNQGNYRKVKAPFVEENLAGNAVQTIVTEQLPLDMVGIATAVRTSIIRSRDPQDLENWLSTATNLMLTTANSGKSFFFKPYDDVIDVNGTSSIDRGDANFGFPDGSRYHIEGCMKFQLRTVKSNPMKGADGIWHARQGSIDISMGVPTGLKSRILDILARGFESSDCSAEGSTLKCSS